MRERYPPESSWTHTLTQEDWKQISLAAVANKFFLTRAAVSFVKEHPDLVYLAKHVTRLAGGPHFQNKVPILAYMRAEKWLGYCFGGGRAYDTRNGIKMQRVKPDVATTDLLETGWDRVFAHLRDDREAPKYLAMDEIAFVEEFGKLMQNRFKTDAQKQGRVSATGALLEQAASFSTVGQRKHAFDTEFHDKFRERSFWGWFRNDFPRLSDKHYQAIMRMLDQPSAKKEASDRGITPRKVSRQREAAMKFLRRKYRKFLGDSDEE